jgi:hypothetical protein
MHSKIGEKQLLFSQEMMEACDYKYVQKSQIIPFKIKGTRKYEIIGCQFVINMNRDRIQMLNLIEEQYQNLYNYQSKIIKIGQVKF